VFLHKSIQPCHLRADILKRRFDSILKNIVATAAEQEWLTSDECEFDIGIKHDSDNNNEF